MLSRRVLSVCFAFVAGSIASVAAAQDCDRFAWQCQGYSGPSGQRGMVLPSYGPATGQPNVASYAALEGEPFPVAAVSLSDIDPSFLRQTVSYWGSEAPGTIVIDTRNHFLY